MKDKRQSINDRDTGSSPATPKQPPIYTNPSASENETENQLRERDSLNQPPPNRVARLINALKQTFGNARLTSEQRAEARRAEDRARQLAGLRSSLIMFSPSFQSEKGQLEPETKVTPQPDPVVEADRSTAETERQAVEAAQLRAAQEAWRRAEAEAKLVRQTADEESKLRAEEKRQRAETEAKLIAEKEREQAETARLQAVEAAKREVEEERQRAEAEAKLAREKAEEEARLRAEEERQRAEAEAKLKAEHELFKAEAEARRKAEAERQRVELEARAERERQQTEEERRRVEAESKRKAEAEARQKAEEEARRKAEEQRLRAEAKANAERALAEARVARAPAGDAQQQLITLTEPAPSEPEAKYCPKCNRVFAADQFYCVSDAVPLLSASAKTKIPTPPKHSAAPLIWTMVGITFLATFIVGFWFSLPKTQTPAVIEQPAATQPAPPIVGGALFGKATALPTPELPEKLKQAGISGQVTVAVTADDKGNVISARAVNGPEALQPAAEEAAKKAKFGLPQTRRRSRTSGTITYNFKL